MKKIENSKFELEKHYIPQKKARNMCNSDSPRKSTIFKKKTIFFQFFRFSCHSRGWTKIFEAIFFEVFKKNLKK